MSIELRMYVLQLSKNVNEKQFNELKYLLVDDVPHGLSEKMKQPHELFHALEQVRKLTPEYLRKAFDAVGRQDLSEDVIQNQHLFQVFSKQYDAPKDEKMSLNGYDAVCDGPAQDNNPHPRKAAVKEGEPIKAHYKPTEKTDDAQMTDMDVDHHQQTDMSVEKKMPQPTTVESMSELHSKAVEDVSELHSTAVQSMPELHSKAVEGASELHSKAVESMPEPQVSGALPDDVVADIGGEGAGSTTEGASAAMNSNPEIASKGPSEGEGALSKKQGARPKDSNPISKAYKAKGPSEQTDHVTTSNQSGSLHSDGSQNKGAASAPPMEESPPGAAAYMGVGAGSSKGPSESDVDFTSESAVHGSMHAHAQVVKSTTTVVTESHSMSVKLDETGGYSGLLAGAGAAAACGGPAYNMTQLKQTPYYASAGYLLTIPQGQHCERREDTYGLVIIENGQQFCIKVQNDNDYACEVEITLGGRFLGVWLVESGQNNTTVISGSSWEPGLLTFFSQTGPAPALSKECLNIEDNGVIECVFVPEAIKLFVETMKRSSDRREVVISPKATVGDLIDILENTYHITGITCLIYNSKEMSRSNTLKKYKVKFEETIRVLTDEEDLVIECPDRDPITMPVDLRKTCVREVLVFLQEKLDCPLDMLRLIRKEKKLPLHEKLKQAFVDWEPVVKLEIAEPIILEVRKPPSEDTETLRTHTFATVASLKEKMVETGRMMEEAQLLFNEKCLEEDDTMCLTEHGIRNGSVIDIKPPPETRSLHRGFGSGTRSFGFAGTRSFDVSSLFGSSGTRGLNLGGSRGLFDDEQSECSFGVDRQTHGLRDLPGGLSEGRFRLTGEQEISTNYDLDYNRKFDKRLGVTLKLILVSSAPGPINFPSLPIPSECGPSSHQSSAQDPARSSGPTRTKVPPPVPE